MAEGRAWTFVAAMCTIIAAFCYAMSQTFVTLFGPWTARKATVYSLATMVFLSIIIFAQSVQKWRWVNYLTEMRRKFKAKYGINKSYAPSVITVLSTIYSAFHDERDTYMAISSFAAIVAALCTSRHIPLVFGELIYVFMGFFIAQLAKVDWVLFGLAVFICLCIGYFHCCFCGGATEETTDHRGGVEKRAGPEVLARIPGSTGEEVDVVVDIDGGNSNVLLQSWPST